MADTLKLIQLNIERGKHMDVTLPFILQEKPDILCLQELVRPLVSQFERAVGPGFFVPMRRIEGNEEGIGIFSRHPIFSHTVVQYSMGTEEVQDYNGSSYDAGHASSRFMLLVADIEVPQGRYRVATTHFPVTSKGSVTEYQRADMEHLLTELAGQGEFVLTGDFNAPRGGEIFSKLAGAYKDNVPAHYKTSLDVPRHRNGTDHSEELADKMVDGIFSTPGYVVSDVRLQGGVSDHCAIVAHVAKQHEG